MTTAATTPDPTMEAISAAVRLGRDGDVESARQQLLATWQQIGVGGDPFHRCTLAHHLADFCPDPAEALVWDVRALDAADAVTAERAQQYHAGLDVAGFYPSLYLNIADNFRRLGAFRAATGYIDSTEQHTSALPAGPYADTIHTAVREVSEAIARQDTRALASAPGPGR
ncbi:MULTISPECIES: hypothetical protein [Pseudonocardia]|uniref:Uncharacterized protein n=2 Tax=Pseudonocardia TaxID=1847 RepID=A0A1Y2MXV0_PSEAH|nr:MULTISPECIES: hypothetical protein [Pseudonocardia]OSY39468.1 hypothetical protein BG845_03414 [Pseudonocardia autotrophica]TDN75294.1 hypothetical protein C8E95_4443 [Pseudonocardia autotrophica]BBF99240.1 hypothetical protein Pdca_04500 [Pseudonocardia autotrophica]GEC24786.1 hypothetical protein PSA01_18150 [Pseudonocardia saturnea]